MNNQTPIKLSGMMVHDPFGMIIVGRSWEVGSEYRYGFNGKENSDEIYGDDNAIDFGARMYDGRLGRWMTIDPFFKQYPQISAYTFAINNPILLIDQDGNTIFDSEGNEVVLVFDTESGELTDIQGTNDEALKNVIFDTWNESETGRTSIKELNANDVTVQVIVSNKAAIWPSQEGNIAIAGITVANYLSSDLTGKWVFKSEDGAIYDGRIYLFNTTIDPEDADDSQIDVIDTKSGTFYLLDDNSKTKAKKIKAYQKKAAKNKFANHSNTDKALDKLMNENLDDYGILVMKIIPLKQVNKAFGYLSTLIHEKTHFLVNVGKEQNDTDGGSEYLPRKKEIESYQQSGRPGI
ncbi:MAG: hypothetical protein IPL12_16805 [Bacteroidetes bacterium]|nr:hypothetical protein [Bacteroidota bacterium]